MSAFHLASASKDEDQDGLDEAGGAVWVAADRAEDLPAHELGVGALAGTALTGVRSVDLALVAGEPSAAGLGIGGSASLRNDESGAAVAVCRRSRVPGGMEGIYEAVFAGGAHVVSCAE